MHRLFIFALIAATSANVIFDGPCPSVKPKENFDFSAYQGSWYEVARYPNDNEFGDRAKCTLAEYTVFGRTGKVRNSHVIDGVQTYIDGDVTLVEPGKVMLTYTFGGVSKNSFFTVLDTDYLNYSIAYSCKYFPDGNNHQVLSWIKSRSPTLDGYSKAIIDDYLKKSTILDTNKYIANDFSPAACQASVVSPITQFEKQ